jgi:phospholipase C
MARQSLWKYACSLLLFHFTFCSTALDAKDKARHFKTTTPIKYVVLIFPENRSFDHFFGTYPHAENLPGEPPFKAKPNTPTVNGLSQGLIRLNQNLIRPFRFAPSQAFTCDPEHDTPNFLQDDANAGLLDQFVQVNEGNCLTVMGYFDGNTVTALWNYAQRFAMSDNSHSTNFDPSAPGAINLISGQTHGAIPADVANFTVAGTLIGDADPLYDKCSSGQVAELTGRNVGNLLNEHNITWGWFSGGFRNCDQFHLDSQGRPVKDYVPHHEPFQFYASTSNPEHLPPSSPSMIGYQDQANHQYDIEDFWTALKIHNLPAVSFIKPPAYQDCHPGNSDPLAFQTFLVETVNRLQKSPEWRKMAIIIAFDDSGGWYDHAMPPIINDSQAEYDTLVPPGNAGTNPPLGGYQGRAAYGIRMPLLIISPFAKVNYVDHAVTDQTSVLRFIEDNWNLGRIGDYSFDEFAGSLLPLFDFQNPNYKRLILDPNTGLKKKSRKRDHSIK